MIPDSGYQPSRAPCRSGIGRHIGRSVVVNLPVCFRKVLSGLERSQETLVLAANNEMVPGETGLIELLAPSGFQDISGKVAGNIIENTAGDWDVAALSKKVCQLFCRNILPLFDPALGITEVDGAHIGEL